MPLRTVSRRVVAILAAAMVAGCISGPNADGWRDPGVHAVDGYWVTSETPCSQAIDEKCRAAVASLADMDPGASAVRASTAGYPMMRGDPGEVTIVIGGLYEPAFVILDLPDGSRRTIGLVCGPGTSADGTYPVEVCHPDDMALWRVSGS